MPIPGDNGQPMKEKRDQEQRITDVANTGACVQKEVKFNLLPQRKNAYLGKYDMQKYVSAFVNRMNELKSRLKPRYVWVHDLRKNPRDRSYVKIKHGELS